VKYFTLLGRIRRKYDFIENVSPSGGNTRECFYEFKRDRNTWCVMRYKATHTYACLRGIHHHNIRIACLYILMFKYTYWCLNEQDFWKYIIISSRLIKNEKRKMQYSNIITIVTQQSVGVFICLFYYFDYNTREYILCL
jgi:hypothetical protein